MNFITEKWKKVQIQYKCGFLSTLIFGLISHGMGLFNKFSMDDDLQYFFHNDNPLWTGRWMRYFLVRLERVVFGDGNYSLPMINGLFSIILIGITVCLLIDLLDMHSTVLCVLIGFAAVSNPGVTHLFGVMYLAHYYAFALLMAVSGSYLVMKYSKWYFILFGIFLMVCSTAIYQAYIPVILSTILFSLIRKSLQDEKEVVFRSFTVAVISCAAFIGLYFLITYIFNKHYGLTLISYKNVNEMGINSFLLYLKRIGVAYQEFFLPSKNRLFNFFPGSIYYLNSGFIFISFILFGMLLYSIRKKTANFIFAFFMILLIPLAVNFIFIMVDRAYCYMLMMYGRVMFFVVFAWVFEKEIGDIHTFFARCMKAVCLGGLAMLAVMYCRYDNICYLQMKLLQTQATRYFTTLITRIQSVEGYNSWQYVSYIGKPDPGRNDNSIEPIPELDNIMFFPYWGLKNTLQGPWKEFMRIWCGYSAHEVDQSYFIDRPEVQDMPHYPAEGSIKVIDDTVVVKF